MSIRVMTAVWDRGTRYAEGTLLVLLALADWADDGGRCFPSVPQIAQKSRLTERQVYGVLKRLRADGVLSMESGGGRGRRTVYQINTAMLSGNTKTNPEKTSGFKEPGNPEIGDTKTLKSATQNPEIGDIPPHPPLGRTVNEPSGRTVRKNHSPYPLAGEGVKEPQVDGMSWGRFRQALKQQLGDAPMTHSNFRELKPGELDFNACFRDWWLIGLEPPGTRAGPPRLVTEAGDAGATAEGLRKYRKRLDELSRQYFGAAVEIVVEQRKAKCE